MSADGRVLHHTAARRRTTSSAWYVVEDGADRRDVVAPDDVRRGGRGHRLPAAVQEMMVAGKTEDVRHIDSAHSLSRPRELAEILVEAAAGSR